MNQRQPAPAPGQAGQATPQNMAAPMLASQGVPAHLMGLMTNPALAAAAAASPLFPPAAMLSNPGAFLTMPEAFVAATSNTQQTTSQTAGAGGVVLPRLEGGGIGNFGVDGSSINQQLAQRQGVSPAPGATLTGANVAAVANMGLAVLSQQNGQLQADAQQQLQPQQVQVIPAHADPNKNEANDEKKARRTDLTPEERAKQNRDRNREHARSTRLRKKAYVQKLKELVEGLHAERTEEVRQRRVAIQHLAEMQNVRRGVVRTFLRFHSGFETDSRKWETILEDNFWFKQPVTPYRSFRRTEIEQVSQMQEP